MLWDDGPARGPPTVFDPNTLRPIVSTVLLNSIVEHEHTLSPRAHFIRVQLAKSRGHWPSR